jgi:hypothetical protein
MTTQAWPTTGVAYQCSSIYEYVHETLIQCLTVDFTGGRYYQHPYITRYLFSLQDFCCNLQVIQASVGT